MSTIFPIFQDVLGKGWQVLSNVYIYSKKKENLLDRKLNENAMVSNSITESKRNFQTLIKKTSNLKK